MQLKNSGVGNIQLAFNKKVDSATVVDYVHIPGGATVELEDKIFAQLIATKTPVTEQKEVRTEMTEELVGSSVKVGKENLTIIEYTPTGNNKEVNLVREMIKAGTLIVVERPKADMKVVDALLAKNKVTIDGMSEDDKVAMYNKLV